MTTALLLAVLVLVALNVALTLGLLALVATVLPRRQGGRPYPKSPRHPPRDRPAARRGRKAPRFGFWPLIGTEP